MQGGTQGRLSCFVTTSWRRNWTGHSCRNRVEVSVDMTGRGHSFYFEHWCSSSDTFTLLCHGHKIGLEILLDTFSVSG